LSWVVSKVRKVEKLPDSWFSASPLEVVPLALVVEVAGETVIGFDP
jgi:hypothetical protein